jgi:cobalamin biosynthesis Mg chelatase CobN
MAGMTYPQVENVWIQAGGNPQAAAMAAAVADASSGFDPGISRTNPDGTTSIGLWLIPKNGQPPGSTDPLANARAAIQLSNNGADWQQWCVAWSDNNCGQDQGKYLGEGSNALASLGQRLTPASYNVIGSSPAGSGTGASAATSTSATTGGQSPSGSHNVLLIGLLVVVIAVVYVYIRRGKRSTEPSDDVG